MSDIPATMTRAATSKQGILPFQINLRTREALAAYAFLTPFIAFFCVFVVRAVINAVRMSFYDYKILGRNRPYIGLDNYAELLRDDVWWQALQNTFMFAVLTVIGTSVLAIMAAVAVTQPIKGKTFFRVLIYMSSLLSVGVVGLVWVWLLSTQYGVINYLLSFIGIRPINWLGDADLVMPAISLTTIWWGMGFPFLIYIAGLESIPDHLYEAAKIDGANGAQLFRYITLPLLRPTILFVTVTGFIAHLQVYGQTLVMTGGGPGRASYTAIYYLYQSTWVAAGIRIGYGAAVAVSLAVVMATLTLLQFVFIGRRVEY